MSTAGSVPVFTGKNALSLGDLDAMGNVVRDNAAVLRSAGRKGRAGYAHAGNAWYVPEPVPGLGESNDFTAEVPGLIAGAEFSGQFDRCIIEDGMLWLPHANIATAVDMETDEVTATAYAGGVHGIEARAGVEATLDAGVIVLPLAAADDTAVRAGLMRGVVVDSAVEAPCISEGVLRLPSAPSGGTAQQISQVVVEDTTDDAGQVDGATLRLDLAQHDSSVGVEPHAGLLYGVEQVSGGTPRITDGKLILPTYSFDPEWFEVDEDGLVTLREEAVAAAVEAELDALAPALAVQVDGVRLESIIGGAYVVKGDTSGSLALHTNAYTTA